MWLIVLCVFEIWLWNFLLVVLLIVCFSLLSMLLLIFLVCEFFSVDCILLFVRNFCV